MKKIFACILAALLTLSLISCNTHPQDTSGDDPALPSDTSLPKTEDETTPPETEPPFDYDGYKLITPTPAEKLKPLIVGYEGQSVALSIPVPEKLATYLGDSSLLLMRDNAEIGEVVSGVPEDASGTRVMDYGESTRGEMTVYYNLLAIPSEQEPSRQFRHSITYAFDVDGIRYDTTLILNYDVLDGDALERLIEGSELRQKKSDAKLGCLLPENKIIPKRILLLGNSFVSYSYIGCFLDTMLKDTHCKVTAVSRGYACTHNGTWNDYIPQIRDGGFDILILCGFYHENDIAALKPFIDACRTANTRLVLFPAHNESWEQAAIDAHPELDVLHWQDEIDLLIDTLGINYWDFCHNDTHKHSTALAGYVGAHMIYRAITGEIPQADRYDHISTDYLEARLGDYMKEGSVTLLADEDIWLLPQD